jgi:hypothetical protein
VTGLSGPNGMAQRAEWHRYRRFRLLTAGGEGHLEWGLRGRKTPKRGVGNALFTVSWQAREGRAAVSNTQTGGVGTITRISPRA